MTSNHRGFMEGHVTNVNRKTMGWSTLFRNGDFTCHMILPIKFAEQRKVRSQTSDNMDR
jgi:hypothetical protein